MISKNPSGDLPQIAESAYVDRTAIICGKVVIGGNVFVGPYTVIRADEVDKDGGMQPISIGANSNIQDGVVIHSKSGAAVTIGENTSIAPRSIVHGPCRVGDRVFIGFNSVLSIVNWVTVVLCGITRSSMAATCRKTSTYRPRHVSDQTLT